jgi:hypothetical protein
MKAIFLSLSLSALFGCSLTSRRLVDSPYAEGGREHRFRYAHGGVQPGSPHESLILHAPTDTATALTVMARPVRWKPAWFGPCPGVATSCVSRSRAIRYRTMSLT